MSSVPYCENLEARKRLLSWKELNDFSVAGRETWPCWGFQSLRGAGVSNVSIETFKLSVLYLQHSGQDTREFLHSCEPVSHKATVLWNQGTLSKTKKPTLTYSRHWTSDWQRPRVFPFVSLLLYPSIWSMVLGIYEMVPHIKVPAIHLATQVPDSEWIHATDSAKLSSLIDTHTMAHLNHTHTPHKHTHTQLQ